MVCYEMKVLIMLYSNQEASLYRTEQRDFMLAIKALLQDQKDAKGGEHHDPIEEIPRKTSGREISITAKRSLGSDADKPDPPATIRINSQNQAQLDPRASELKRQLQDLESSASIAAVQSPGSPPGTTNHRRDQPSEHDPDIQVRPRESVVRPNLPEPKLRMGNHLFLLNPVVEDFFDKVELTWLLQNFQMRESAIHRYLNQQDYERNDVFDMLHKLHPYEKKILDGVIFGIDMSTEGSLLSLKRTKTTICHRDIIFNNVPGLQFVVRRERQIPDEDPRIIPVVPPVSPRERTRHRREFWAKSVSPAGGHDRRHFSRAAIESDEDSYSRYIQHPILSSDSEDEGYSNTETHQEPMSLPEHDEDALIDDMLKRYTTLFD